MAQVLGVDVKIAIPKPIGARIIVVPINTTMTIEERGKRSNITVVVADREKPKQTVGIVVKVSIDPLIEENFKVGMGVFFGHHSGVEQTLEGKTFRSLEFNEIVSTLEEEEVPEPYKIQVRHFLLSPVVDDEL